MRSTLGIASCIVHLSIRTLLGGYYFAADGQESQDVVVVGVDEFFKNRRTSQDTCMAT